MDKLVKILDAMALFTSSREQQLWLWVLAVLVAIFATLFIGQPLISILSNQNIQAALFMLGMALVGAAIVVHALKTKPKKIELVVLLGIVAVYILFFLRLGLAERSHLLEYSVLAIFIHKALRERVHHGKQISMPALLAFVISFLIGVLDECIQIVLPNRVFDLEDIIFNGFAVTMAIGANVVFAWVRKRINKP